MKRHVLSFRAFLVFLLLALGSSDSGGSARSRAPAAASYATFKARLAEGADCAELFEIRNSLEPSSGDIPRINEDLRSVGCYSSTSTRRP